MPTVEHFSRCVCKRVSNFASKLHLLTVPHEGNLLVLEAWSWTTVSDLMAVLLQVLYEAMADKQTRKSRAQALQVLGRLFQQAALAATAAASAQVCPQLLVCILPVG